MSEVIYADVLVVINFYVTYFLLLAATLISGERLRRIRLLFSSFFGGFYSLFILVDFESKAAELAVRLGAVLLPVLIAFGVKNLAVLVRAFVSYLVCSFVFAGLMFALWYFVCPSGMYFNGTAVYFDIDILTLAIFTVICYGFLRAFDFFFRKRAPVNTVFYCTVKLKDESFTLRAFLDTGNSLSDSFTGKPVIIVCKECLPSSVSGGELPENQRFIFCKTLSGKGMLPAFTPESVSLKGAELEFTTDSVMLAVTEEKLFGGSYDAILPMGLFDKIYERKDERESEEISFDFKKAYGRDKREALSVTGFLRKRNGESSSAADKGEGE